MKQWKRAFSSSWRTDSGPRKQAIQGLIVAGAVVTLRAGPPPGGSEYLTSSIDIDSMTVLTSLPSQFTLGRQFSLWYIVRNAKERRVHRWK